MNACSYLLMSSVVVLLHVDKFAFASGCNDHSFLSHNTMMVLAAAAAAETKSPNFAVPLLLLHALYSFSQHTLMHPDSWLTSGNFLLLRMNRNDFQIYNRMSIVVYIYFPTKVSIVLFEAAVNCTLYKHSERQRMKSFFVQQKYT